MALPPRFLPAKQGSPTARHVLEVYLDFVCPFSAKQLQGIRQHLVPLVENELKQDLAIIIRPYPQAFHDSSTFTAEAFLAVVKSAPACTYAMAYLLMERQKEFFNSNVQDESPNSIRKRLAALASEAGADEQQVLKLISWTGESINSGTAVTDDIKYHMKLGRQNSIHVTPTVILDGLVDSSVSSSFGAEEWKNFLDKKVRGQ